MSTSTGDETSWLLRGILIRHQKRSAPYGCGRAVPKNFGGMSNPGRASELLSVAKYTIALLFDLLSSPLNAVPLSSRYETAPAADFSSASQQATGTPTSSQVRLGNPMQEVVRNLKLLQEGVEDERRADCLKQLARHFMIPRVKKWTLGDSRHPEDEDGNRVCRFHCKQVTGEGSNLFCDFMGLYPTLQDGLAAFADKMKRLAHHVSRYEDDELLGLKVGHLWDRVLEDDQIEKLCRKLVARGTAKAQEELQATGTYLAGWFPCAGEHPNTLSGGCCVICGEREGGKNNFFCAALPDCDSLNAVRGRLEYLAPVLAAIAEDKYKLYTLAHLKEIIMKGLTHYGLHCLVQESNPSEESIYLLLPLLAKMMPWDGSWDTVINQIRVGGELHKFRYFKEHSALDSGEAGPCFWCGQAEGGPNNLICGLRVFTDQDLRHEVIKRRVPSLAKRFVRECERVKEATEKAIKLRHGSESSVILAFNAIDLVQLWKGVVEGRINYDDKISAQMNSQSLPSVAQESRHLARAKCPRTFEEKISALKARAEIIRKEDDELLGLEVGDLWGRVQEDADLENKQVEKLCRALVTRGTAKDVSFEELKAAGKYLAWVTPCAGKHPKPPSGGCCVICNAHHGGRNNFFCAVRSEVGDESCTTEEVRKRLAFLARILAGVVEEEPQLHTFMDLQNIIMKGLTLYELWDLAQVEPSVGRVSPLIPLLTKMLPRDESWDNQVIPIFKGDHMHLFRYPDEHPELYANEKAACSRCGEARGGQNNLICGLRKCFDSNSASISIACRVRTLAVRFEEKFMASLRETGFTQAFRAIDLVQLWKEVVRSREASEAAHLEEWSSQTSESKEGVTGARSFEDRMPYLENSAGESIKEVRKPQTNTKPPVSLKSLSQTFNAIDLVQVEGRRTYDGRISELKAREKKTNESVEKALSNQPSKSHGNDSCGKSHGKRFRKFEDKILALNKGEQRMGESLKGVLKHEKHESLSPRQSTVRHSPY